MPAIRPGDLPCEPSVVHPNGVSQDDTGGSSQRQPREVDGAVGPKAAWLTEDHPLHYGFGPGSPLEKLCLSGREVLLMGTLFDSVTLPHYAECLADVPDKRVVRYGMPVLLEDQRRWVDVEEFDTSDGIRDWGGGDYFEAIVEHTWRRDTARPASWVRRGHTCSTPRT
jgi:hypothetical protein